MMDFHNSKTLPQPKGKAFFTVKNSVFYKDCCIPILKVNRKILEKYTFLLTFNKVKPVKKDCNPRKNEVLKKLVWHENLCIFVQS
jgi:hypothetical protein